MATAALCFRASALSVACFLLAVPLLMAQDPSNLSLEHYSKTCPNAEHVVRAEMECAVRDEPHNAALMLRLHFHDCFVQVVYPHTLLAAHTNLHACTVEQ